MPAKGKKDIELEYFVGNTTKYEWAGVHTYTPFDGDEMEEFGELFSVISIQGDPAFDSEKAGNLLVDILQDSYYDTEFGEQDILKRLSYSTKELHKRIVQIVEREKSLQEGAVELDITALVKKGDVLYVVSIGDCLLYGMRKGECVDLTPTLKNLEGRGPLKMASLQIFPEDSFLIVTSSLDNSLSLENREAILEKGTVGVLEGVNLKNEAMSAALLIEYLHENDNSAELKKNIEEDGEKIENTKELVEEESNPEDIRKEIFRRRQDEIFESETMGKEKLDKVVGVGKKVGDSVLEYAQKINATSFKQNVRRMKTNRNTKTFMYILIQLFEFIQKFLSSIIEFIVGNIFVGRKSMHIRGASSRRVNWRFLFFLILVFGVGVYFVFGRIQENRRRVRHELEMRAQIDTIEEELESMESEIRELVVSRDNMSVKKEFSSKLEEVRTELEEVDLFEEEKNDLLERVLSIGNKLYRRIIVEDDSIIKDFGIVEESELSDIDFYDGNLYISDKSQDVIYRVDSSGGGVEIVGSGLDGVRTLSIAKDGGIVFVDEEENRALGIIELKNNNRINRVVGVTKDRLGDVINIEAVELAPGDSRLYGVRYQQGEVIQLNKSVNGYGLPQVRMSTEIEKPLDIDIDQGRIYLIQEGIGLRRFLGDQEYENSIRGMMNGDNINSSNAVYVGKRYIYLVDSTSSRIIVMTKNRGDDPNILDMVAQYDLSGIQRGDQIKDVVTDTNEGNIFVIVGSRVARLTTSDLTPFVY